MIMFMKKIKVLHVITRLDAGGSSTNTIETVARLNRDRFDVSLVSGPTVDWDHSIPCQFIPDLQREISPVKDIKAFFTLYKLIKVGNFDIVHTHTSKAGIVGRWAAKCAGVKRIIHTPHGHVFYGYFGPLKTSLFILIERITALITDNIITLTDRGKQEHIDLKIAAGHKFVTIYSGIDVHVEAADTGEELKNKLSIPQDRIVFGSVARLEPIKGVSYLIEAMAEVVKKHPQTHLVLVGDGKERGALKQQVNTLDLGAHVTFTGFQKNVNAYLQIMDVFVLASLNEGMGRVFLEAMVFGKPVIGTRVGGVPEIIQDGQNGFCVESKNPQALSHAMLQLIENPALREQIGSRGKIMAGEKFSLEKMVSDIEHLYGIK
jgi:glycosyltransferase involved in cell wall biosynthesis